VLDPLKINEFCPPVTVYGVVVTVAGIDSRIDGVVTPTDPVISTVISPSYVITCDAYTEAKDPGTEGVSVVMVNEDVAAFTVKGKRVTVTEPATLPNAAVMLGVKFTVSVINCPVKAEVLGKGILEYKS
jgi:hypothetical protein